MPKSSKKKSSGGAKKIVPLAALEKQAILNALAFTKDDKLKAAKLLGIGKTTLYRKIKEYGW
jgi:transcriptional regulator with PAS, ATPase and Fis domain